MRPAEPLHYQRRFALAGAIATLLELLGVGAPLAVFFQLDEPKRLLLGAAGPIALGCAWLIWWVAVRAWRAPIDHAVRRRRAGEMVDGPSLEAAYQAMLSLPRRAAWLRLALGGLVALLLATLLARRASFPPRAVATVIAVTLLHGLGAQVIRVLLYARLLERLRDKLLPDHDPVRLFHDLYRPRLYRAALTTGALASAAVAGFTYFFVPINLEQYIQLETWFPLTLLALALVWVAVARRLTRPVARYLAVALLPRAERPPTDIAIAAYRAAQALPYQLAVAKLALAVLGEALLVVQGPLIFGIDLENAVFMFGEALVVTVGMAIYEVLWHRATMRPLLTHLAARHRPSPETVRTPFSLRTKMLASFGGLTFFACGLSLLWSFVQYKTLATSFIQRETELRLAATLSDIEAHSAHSEGGRLAFREIVDALEDAARDAARDKAVFYYLPTEGDSRPVAFGGGKEGPPPLPWYGEQLMRRREAGQVELSSLQLSGAYARVYDDQHVDLGSVAVLYPGYRGRGGSIDRPIVVLVFFFVMLAAASMGIVVFVAADLTAPIRLLEKRADAMAKGDLTRPVIHSAGEADEIGRLTFAFEEMRRALNEKLRSSTEINLSLEQEVTRRTAELERRNQEIKGALEALQRAQAELVRSEKMASMGRLVAGIAHEINNPVNAVVNTAGPLELTLEELIARTPAMTPEKLGELSGDVREMLRVIQRGARRTKEIVQALHNYSRGDDDRLVDVDLHRGLDESLDLLRHHLKHGITVERAYGDVGRVRGYAGQLHQVFMNLLTNAAQALAEHERGGVIRIETRRDGDRVVITVADDGPGIPKDLLARIFDPFFTTKDVGQGSGLGLSIVHGIVERHGGTIAVDSEPGRGTTFTVTLPADQPQRVSA
ncbi:MAG: sensor histidine kinase [Myxococcales bacterium]|nr:sensor histidine kinase [Myxococcales bacterium]